MSTEPDGIPEVKLVDFDLPFVLFLRESLGDAALKEWAKAYAEGQKPLPYSRYAPCAEKPGFIVIGGSLPVFIPPKELAPHYLIRLPQLTVGLRTLRRVNAHRPTIIKGEVPGDRSGRSSFSSVRVLFDLADIAPDRHWDMQFVLRTKRCRSKPLHRSLPRVSRPPVRRPNHDVCHSGVPPNNPVRGWGVADPRVWVG